MPKRERHRTALTIAGSDSGAGAGVQADLKTFEALGVHGTCALTCLTAQNPQRVIKVQAVSTPMVQAQLQAVFEAFPPQAIKTGMLYSAAVIKAVADALPERGRAPLVIDPVMVSTSGAPLLRPNAIRELTRCLFPRATLLTPNLPEASVLLARPLRQIEDLRSAARELHERFGCAALVKGGHLEGLQTAIDIFYDGKEELLLEAPRIRGVTNHGTGCAYAAAVTGYLALGCDLSSAVQRAKNYVSQAIASSVRVREQDVLDFFWEH